MNTGNLLSRVSEWLRRRVASIAKHERAVTGSSVTEESDTPAEESLEAAGQGNPQGSATQDDAVSSVAPQEAPAAKGKRRKGGKTLMVQAEEYLWSHYAFRYNVLSGEYEYARLATSMAEEESPAYTTLNAEARRHLLMQLQREGINIPYISQVQTIIECGRAEQYNPLLHYYGSLPTWDGTDHIGELFGRLTDDAMLLELLRRWIVGMVAQATGRTGGYGHSLCPLLISERQGWGKSQFTRMLVPPRLEAMYTDTFNPLLEEHSLRRMAQHLLVNLDEFDRFDERSHTTLKMLLQLPRIKVKRPHRAQFEMLARTASFIGTSNRRSLLRDLTGSRRYICVELRGPIDTDTPICHEQLYAQALHLLDEGMQYWLTEEETRQLEQHNSAYMVAHGAEQLFARHFAPLPYTADMPDEQLWSAVAVYDYLHRKDPRLMRHIERTTFAMYIRAQGIEQVRRNNKRLFPLRLI